MEKSKILEADAALNSLKNRLITNYDLTKFEFEVKDIKQKKYIDFICKRNLAYNAAKSNHIKDFIVRYNNFIAAIPSLADRATKQYYKAAMLAKNEHFFEFVYRTLIQINGDNAGNNSLSDDIKINMLENYLFNHYAFNNENLGELNSMACLVNDLLLVATSNSFADKEIKAIHGIIAAIISKKIAAPTRAAIEDMIKCDNNISNETKNNIINKNTSVDFSKKPNFHLVELLRNDKF